MTRSTSWLHLLILFGVPLALTILMAFHPWPYDNYIDQLAPIARWWTILHILQFILFPFAAAAVWLLTDGLRGSLAVVSRLGAVLFALFYSLADALAGVSSGLLAQQIPSVPTGEQTVIATAIGMLFGASETYFAFKIGAIGWMIALVAAAIALYRAGAPLIPVILLAVPAYLPFGFDHAFPFGSLTFGSLFLLALWLEGSRRQREEAASRHVRTTAPVPRSVT